MASGAEVAERPGGSADAIQPVVSPRLVGRDSELAAVVAMVTAPPSVVVVEGEAGVGKTRLVGELLARPELSGSRRLVGRCRQIREPFPLGAVIEALRDVGEGLRGLRLSAVAGALRPLIPELAEWLPPAPDPLDDRSAQRHRVFRGAAEVLSALGSSRPVVLVLEDLHWVDEQTRDFLAFWLSEPVPGVSLVLTYRGEDADADVLALTARLREPLNYEHLILAPLDASATGALASAILCTDAISAEFAGYLRERTGGIPLAIEEVIALVRARGLLVARGGAWSRKPLEALDVPRGIRNATLQRVASLPAGAQRIAEAAAVLRDPVPLPALGATAGGEDDVTAAAEQAISCGLLVEDASGIAFRHVLAAEAVYGNLSGPRRRALHARAAAALQIVSPASLGRIAYHLHHAGDLGGWVDAAEAAADQAIALAADEEAARLLAEVLAEAPFTADRRGELAIKLGWAALDTLHPGEAAGPLGRALEQAISRAQQGELRFLLALALEQSGEKDLRRERGLLLAAIPDLEDRPDLQAWAMVAVSILSPPEVPRAEDLDWASRALEVAQGSSDRLLEVFVAGKAGSLLALLGDQRWRDVTSRVMELTGETPRQRREVNAYYSIGVSACYAGHLPTAEQLLTLGLGAPTVQENRQLEMRLRAGLALLHLFQGGWGGLDDEAGVLLRELGDYPSGRVDIELVAGCLALARGELDEADSRLSAVTELARGAGIYEVAPVAAAAAARAAQARGDMPRALSCLDVLLEAVQSKGVWPAACWALPAAVQTWAAAGRHSQARRFLDEAEVALRGMDAPLARAAVLHGSGILSASAPDLMAAADLYDAVPVPYTVALAREQAAVALLSAGQGEAAQAPLREAITVYSRLGARWDYDRAAALARSHGVSLPSRQRGEVRRRYDESLSPREREVAELAATGRTNKQIAAELFVSAKTVDNHLTAAMRKLGVHSRTALAHRVAAATASADEQMR
jgi:DNA-binding CsgD family transcriptional regulator